MAMSRLANGCEDAGYSARDGGVFPRLGTLRLPAVSPPRDIWRQAAWAFLALFALLAIAPADAATKTDRGKETASRKAAFVVGNSKYRHIGALANPSRDARAVARALERIGFDVTTVIDGDQKSLTRSLSRFAERSRGADIALFYFAGHGIQINGENYLLPVSVKASAADAILKQGMSLNEVRNRLHEANAGLSIFILDSCRENPFGPLATKRTSETAIPLRIGSGLAQMQSAAGMLIAYATQPGKLAFDGQGAHSPFTDSLLRHLEEPGLEIRLMLGRVREDVVAKTAGGQIPWVEEAVLGEFYFSETGKIGAGSKGADEDEVVFWRSIWKSSNPDDYKAYLAKFPDGAFASLANNRLTALETSTRLAEAAPIQQENVETLSTEDWRLVKNSLYWLGFYNGRLAGAPDTSVTNSIRAFQTSIYKPASGQLSRGQLKQLHDAAATSLISLGERLSDRLAFDSARLRSVNRGISDIALPAYHELKQRLAGVPDGAKVLAEARAQLEAMQTRRDDLSAQFRRASRQYLTVVAATGSGYADQVRAARSTRARSGTENVSDRFLTSRRQVFLKHALDYENRGSIDEKKWLDEFK